MTTGSKPQIVELLAVHNAWCAYCHGRLHAFGTWRDDLKGLYCDAICARLAEGDERCWVPQQYR